MGSLGGAASASRPSVVAIVPVLDAKEELKLSLPALLLAMKGAFDEIIVVDDGSHDDSAGLARQAGARVLMTDRRASGPAHARNIGAAASKSELLVFVDADVVVHRDAVTLLVAALQEDGVAAAYGSYDAAPADRGFASLYMNLRHHHGHRQASDDASTFWSGLGAIRRSAFDGVRGFDAETYTRPSIEDIDLGRRVRASGGRIRRVPAAQGTHLKRWSVASVVHTDITRRALPWSRLLVRHPEDFTDLNVSGAERAKAAVAFAFMGSVLAAVLQFTPAWTVALLAVVAILVSRSLFVVFLRGAGPVFAVAAILFHQLYFIYSAAAYAFTLASHVASRARNPRAKRAH